MNEKCMAGGDTILPDSSNKKLGNPFVHHLELTSTYEKIKAGILTVIVLPIRLCIIICLLIAAWLMACVGLYGVTEVELQEKPLTGWRRKLRDLVTLLGCWTYYAGGMRYTVKGRQAPREEAPILVIAPHSTFFDAGIVYETGFPSIIVRRESGLNPFLGKLINYTQPVYVWREDPNSRQKTIQQIINRAKSKLNWSQVLIFPEGTCTNRSCLITFKPGAFYPGVPVQPVLLRYPNKLDTLTWTWEGPGALKLMWLTLVQPHSNCEIEFLPVYTPSEEEKKDPKLYAQNVRKLMADALGVPMLDYTYDDCQLVSRAKQLNLTHSSKLLQVLKLRIRLGLNRSHIEEEIVNKCPDLLSNTNKKILLSYAEFASVLSISPTEHALENLFQLFNENNCDKIDWREYLLSVMLVCDTTSRGDMFQLAFKLCGNKDGYLSKEDAIMVLRLILDVSLSQAEDLCNSLGSSESGYVQYSNFEEYFNKDQDGHSINKKKTRSKAD